MHKIPEITCSGLALRPPISTYRRGAADPIIKAMIAPAALYDIQNMATGTATAAATKRAVVPDASGQSRSAVAVMRNKRGVGLGIDAVEEPIFIQIKRDEYLNITTFPCSQRLSNWMHGSSYTGKTAAKLTVKDLAGRWFSGGVKTKAQPLAGDKEQICRAQQKISAPQPPGLSAQPEQPFQSAILHPLWRLPQRSRQKRKSGSNRQNGYLETISEFICPYLLAWAAQANKNNLRAGLPDPFGNAVGGLSCNSPKC